MSKGFKSFLFVDVVLFGMMSVNHIATGSIFALRAAIWLALIGTVAILIERIVAWLD